MLVASWSDVWTQTAAERVTGIIRGDNVERETFLEGHYSIKIPSRDEFIGHSVDFR